MIAIQLSPIFIGSTLETGVIFVLGALVAILAVLYIRLWLQHRNHEQNLTEEAGRIVRERTGVIQTTNRELQKRQAVSEILSEISSRFITLEASQISSEIPNALSRIAQAFEAQRANIFLPPEEGPDFEDQEFYVDLSYQWFESDVGPVSPSLHRVYPRQFPWVSDHYFKGKTALVVHPKDLPETALAERKLFELMGWTSLIVIPLFVEKRFVGSLNFSTIDHAFVWPQLMVDEMRVVGEIFGNALDRAQKSIALQALRQDAIDGEERERERIARELHDQMGGALTGLKMHAASLQRKLKEEGSSLVDHANRISEIIDDTLPDVRRICSELRPAILDDLDLPQALEWQSEQFTKRTGIPCEFDLFVPFELPSRQDRDVAVYRITQELLTNVIRHADASNVTISLTSEDEKELVLSVADNGTGFDAGRSKKQGSFGLQGVRERAEHLGGNFSVRGIPNSGTKVTIRVPIEIESEEAQRQIAPVDS